MSTSTRWLSAGRIAGWMALALQLGACALVERGSPEEPLYPDPAPAEVDWTKTLTRGLEPLAHDRGDRWPLVIWHGVGFEALAPAQIAAMDERGFVQHLRLRRPDVDAARALAAAGMPVILMEGAGGAWPYDTVGDDRAWRLEFPAGAKVPAEWRRLPDPTRLAGWERARDLTRARLERYKQNDVNVDAVWLDYEGALLNDDYQALRASTAASRLPASLLADEQRYRDYRRVHWLGRLSRYLAAPVRRAYPQAAVTNWVVMLSSRSHPVSSWTGWRHPPSPPSFFTHTNPIAYGIDTYFLSAWPDGHEVNRLNVDRFYTHLLLRQVSMDALNRARERPDMGAVVWVARWVPDHPDERVPVMSRAAYREALRHIWLRGVDAMQIFNPARQGYERYAIHEVEDAQRVYDEILEYRPFLERGEVLNYDVPDRRDARLLWSGLRLDDRALVRVTNLGVGQKRVYLCVTRNRCENLAVPARGKTYVFEGLN